jgi:hydrogenase maturation protein HypF
MAVKSGLVGYVRNLGDARVEIAVEGENGSVKRFMEGIREKRSSLARIYDLKANLLEVESKTFAEFSIRESWAERQHSGSVIPPDVAICDDCVREFRDPRDRRKVRDCLSLEWS